MTFVGERDRQRWSGIERFLGKEVRREEIPAEFGEAPKEYGGSHTGNKKRRKGKTEDKKAASQPDKKTTRKKRYQRKPKKEQTKITDKQ